MRELGIEGRARAAELVRAAHRRSFSSAHGRRLIGWDEILEGGLAPNATVMSWRGIEGAVAAAAAGHDAVLSPAPTLYFDNRPLDAPTPAGPRPGREHRGRLSLRSGAGRAERGAARAHSRRAGEHLDRAHAHRGSRRVHDLSARRCASPKSAGRRRNGSTGSRSPARLPAQLARYRALGIGLRASAGDTVPQPRRRTSHELSLCTDKIVLSLEDDAPLQGDRAVFLVDIMNPCWIYPGADLSQGDRACGRRSGRCRSISRSATT